MPAPDRYRAREAAAAARRRAHEVQRRRQLARIAQPPPDHHANSDPGPDGSPFTWLQPPSDEVVHQWLAKGQHRWLFVLQVLAYAGVAYSLYGLARNSYWTSPLLGPLAVLIVEQLLSLRTSTHKRRVTLPDHLFLVETWAPSRFPSVDVFLTVCGEDPSLVNNTLSHVVKLAYPGEMRVHVLDDGASPVVEGLASRYGVRYLARPGSDFKKAGNLQYALERTEGDIVLILDADYAVRSDFLMQTVPYMDEPSVGIVQTPQYQLTEKRMKWLERCAGATQEMFYRFIQPSRSAVGATICCGGSALYRRKALDAIGGFPLIGTSEDIYTGLEMAQLGFVNQYVPVLASTCASPDELDSFISQQYRWCEGSLTLVTSSRFHANRTMSLGQRLCYWSGFLYYLSTAIMSLLAPVGVLIMLLLYPDRVRAFNVYPLIPATLIWLVIYPFIATGRWRTEVLRVQVIYGFAHLFCIYDQLRDKMSEWVPTNAKVKAPLGQWVRYFMLAYIGITQPAIAVGIVLGLWHYGVGNYWLITALSLLNFYIFVPVWWLAYKTTRRAARARRTSQAPPADDSLSALTVAV